MSIPVIAQEEALHRNRVRNGGQVSVRRARTKQKRSEENCPRRWRGSSGNRSACYRSYGGGASSGVSYSGRSGGAGGGDGRPGVETPGCNGLGSAGEYIEFVI